MVIVLMSVVVLFASAYGQYHIQSIKMRVVKPFPIIYIYCQDSLGWFSTSYTKIFIYIENEKQYQGSTKHEEQHATFEVLHQRVLTPRPQHC